MELQGRYEELKRGGLGLIAISYDSPDVLPSHARLHRYYDHPSESETRAVTGWYLDDVVPGCRLLYIVSADLKHDGTLLLGPDRYGRRVGPDCPPLEKPEGELPGLF